MTLGRWIVIVVAASSLHAPARPHDLSEEVDQLFELMELRPGMNVADVGAGDGEFAEALARRVGSKGHVFANEIDDGELRKIARRIERSDLANMSLVEGEATKTRLPESCCEAILLRYVYHHISEREAMRSSLRQSLRPQGVLVVVEKLEDNGHGISLDEMIEEITADGFRVVSRHPRWGDHEEHHAAVFVPSR